MKNLNLIISMIIINTLNISKKRQKLPYWMEKKTLLHAAYEKPILNIKIIYIKSDKNGKNTPCKS